MKKTIIAIGLIAIIFLSVKNVQAHDPMIGSRYRGMERKGFFLNPEQRTKLRELQLKFNEETAQIRGGILTKRLELQSLWTNPNTDAKAIMDKEKEFRELQNQMAEKIVQYKLEVRKLLTPEQISQFRQNLGMFFSFGHSPMMNFDLGMGFRGPGFEMWY